MQIHPVEEPPTEQTYEAPTIVTLQITDGDEETVKCPEHCSTEAVNISATVPVINESSPTNSANNNIKPSRMTIKSMFHEGNFFRLFYHVIS